MPIDSGPASTGTLGTEPDGTDTLGTDPAGTGTLGTISDADVLKIAQDWEASGKVPVDAQPLVDKYGIVVNDFGNMAKCYDPVTKRARWGDTKELCVADIAWQNLRLTGKL